MLMKNFGFFIDNIEKNIKINYFFIIFIIISGFFIYTFPNQLYPDFNNLDRNFKNVLNAYFSGSTEVKSKTYGGKLEVHNLLTDQLFLTPQLKIIQCINFFYDLSSIKNLNISSNHIKYYFLLITTLIVFLLIFIDKFLNFYQENKQKNTIFFTSLLFPSSLMSITVPSSEAIFTVIIIFLFSRAFEKNLNLMQIIFYLILGVYCFFLDSGNSILSYIFIFNVLIMYGLIKFNKLFFSIVFLTTILFILLFVNEIIFYLAYATDSHKIHRIIGDIHNTPLQNRELYEISKRFLFLIVTLLAIFTSSKNLVISSTIFILYLIYNFLFNFITKRKTIFNNISDYELAILLNTIFLPFVIVYMLPLHAYGKYYLFLIPIIFKIFSKVMNINKVAKLNIFFSILFIFNIIFFNF